METFSALLALCVGNSPVTGEGQWRGSLMFSLICAWINGRVNNREVGDLRRHCTHRDVIVLCCIYNIEGSQYNPTVCTLCSLQSWILSSIMKHVFFWWYTLLQGLWVTRYVFFVLVSFISNRNNVIMTSSNGNIFRVTGLLWVVTGGFPHKNQWRGT